jgi:predicted dehydrogenase
MSKTVDAATRQELAQFRGGSMFELGCHLIDPLLHLMGEPHTVTGYLKQTRPEQDSLYDNTLAVFDFGIATATIRSAVVEVEGGGRRQFVVCGDRGTVAIQPLEPPSLELTLSQPQGNFQRGRQRVTLNTSRGRYYGAWLDLARVIRGEKSHDFSHAHDLAVQAALLRACGYSANS